ncbi:MAG TPA: PhzF family phenazine biosynthesis protein, partial [Hyphomicrobiales bacterium]|nr:PhzF family phenazine biosynthesis protein [Hyphomicrobiales bacterium]
MERLYHHLNVFTERADGGNPLAVVTETDGLDSETMQSIAKRIGLSETVFVFEPENPAHLASIRIFTPGAE